MEFIFIHKLIVFLINLVGIWLVILVYQNNPKEKKNKIFILMVVSMFLWVNFAFLARLVGIEQPNLSLLFLKIGWFATPLFFTFLYFLTIYLLKKEKKYQVLSRIIIFLGGTTSLIVVSTNLIIKEIKFINGNLSIIYGEGMLFFLGTGLFLICATLYPLYKEYLQFSKKEKLKIEYFFIGIFIFYLGNAIFNITLPVFFGIVHLYWIGDYSTIFLLGFTAYAIVKHQLFEIKVVLTSLFVALIAILLAIDVFLFTSEFWLQILKGLALIIFLFFGYYLIKSVLQEIKRREELESLTTELQVAYIKLNAANLKLQKLDQTKSEFISIASHQLRTPLTAIKGYISMIIDGTYGKLAEGFMKPMEKVYLSNERLIKLVNDLLNLSRLEAGKIKFEPSLCSLEKIIDGVVDELKINAQKKNLNLEIEKPLEKLPEIMVDENKLRQVLLNILDNAIKYTQQGGIVIKFEQIGIYQQIKISDTGEGMTKDEIEELFQSFSRTGAGNRFYFEGAGIGLYAAKKFVEMHHGEVWAESPGKSKGSTFYIKLPIK